MNLLYRHKKLVIIVIFAVILIVGLYFFISMVSNKSLEKFGNKKKSNNENKKSNNEAKKSNINQNADKVLYYFYFASCPFCVKFSQDANGWNAIRAYAKDKGYTVMKKDIHADKLTQKEQEYVNKNLKTVPHLTIHNKTKNSWTEYKGNRDLISLKKFVEK